VHEDEQAGGGDRKMQQLHGTRRVDEEADGVAQQRPEIPLTAALELDEHIGQRPGLADDEPGQRLIPPHFVSPEARDGKDDERPGHQQRKAALGGRVMGAAHVHNVHSTGGGQPVQARRSAAAIEVQQGRALPRPRLPGRQLPGRLPHRGYVPSERGSEPGRRVPVLSTDGEHDELDEPAGRTTWWTRHGACWERPPT
jgi:hypothetical protein